MLLTFFLQFDYLLVSLMTLILAFNADFYTLVKRDKVEEIQMKYIMMLKRYIRYGSPFLQIFIIQSSYSDPNCQQKLPIPSL